MLYYVIDNDEFVEDELVATASLFLLRYYCDGEHVCYGHVFMQIICICGKLLGHCSMKRRLLINNDRLCLRPGTRGSLTSLTLPVSIEGGSRQIDSSIYLQMNSKPKWAS